MIDDKPCLLAHVTGRMSKWVGRSDEVLGNAMRDRAQDIVNEIRKGLWKT